MGIRIPSQNSKSSKFPTERTDLEVETNTKEKHSLLIVINASYTLRTPEHGVLTFQTNK